MRAGTLVFLIVSPLAASAFAAEPIACPELSAAVQIGACPSEAELRYAFTAFCSDNARLYTRDTDECTDFAQFGRRKNIALWESADGRFQGYVSCQLSAATVRNARAARISVAREGSVTRLVCTYPQAVTFVHRVRGECRIEGDGDCRDTPAACAARCN